MTNRKSSAICLAGLQALLWLTCSNLRAQDEAPAKKAPAKKAAAAAAGEAPATFKVKFDTSKGPIEVEVHRAWAPKGADHFYQLVKSGFYDEARFFRVVPDFVVQFGLAADPAVTAKWNKPITDDPVKESNRAGTLVYATAGPNTRTSQLFINLGGNQRLDGMGFAPFGEVVGDGMNVVKQIYSGDAERPEQGAITSQGNAYLKAKFPKLDYIKKATIE